MTQEQILTLLTLLAVIIGIVVNVAGLVTKHDKQVRAEASRDAKLDSIILKVDSVCVQQTEVKDDIGKLTSRVVVVEESTKSAHKRLDGLCDEHRDYVKIHMNGG